MGRTLVNRLRGVRGRDDRGATLVELMVTMGVFVIFLGLMTAATTQMFGAMRKHRGIADNLDATRKIMLRLDKQVRYANNVNTPGTGTDGNKYVEFRTGNSGQQQTCTQWRLVVSTKQLQYRTWQPILAGSGTVTASAWNTVATGISEKSGTAIWSIASPAADSQRQQLTVTFVATNGQPAKSSTSQVALTAQNTATNTPISSVCTEIGRP